MTVGNHAIERCLVGLAFPAGRPAVLAHVHKLGGQPDVVDQLTRLPSGVYTDVEQITAALRHDD